MSVIVFEVNEVLDCVEDHSKSSDQSRATLVVLSVVFFAVSQLRINLEVHTYYI